MQMLCPARRRRGVRSPCGLWNSERHRAMDSGWIFSPFSFLIFQQQAIFTHFGVLMCFCSYPHCPSNTNASPCVCGGSCQCSYGKQRIKTALSGRIWCLGQGGGSRNAKRGCSFRKKLSAEFPSSSRSILSDSPTNSARFKT